jgi:hypothetical protein
LDPDKPRSPITVQRRTTTTRCSSHQLGGRSWDYHDYLHFIDGAWRSEGSPRREAQSTIDNDPARGPITAKSTIYESRVAFMVDDPNGPNAVPTSTASAASRPVTTTARHARVGTAADTTKYLNDGTAGTLDLWHHRLLRGNPIGLSEDQNVKQIPLGGEAGGRFGDAGNAPFQSNSIVAGKPTYTLDNEDRLTGNSFAFAFAGHSRTRCASSAIRARWSWERRWLLAASTTPPPRAADTFLPRATPFRRGGCAWAPEATATSLRSGRPSPHHWPIRSLVGSTPTPSACSTPETRTTPRWSRAVSTTSHSPSTRDR